MSNYPPGVTGNEPQITGEWPCDVCGGTGGESADERCEACKGSGIIPEDNISFEDILRALTKVFNDEAWGEAFLEDNSDDYLVMYTNLKAVGGNWYRVET